MVETQLFEPMTSLNTTAERLAIRDREQNGVFIRIIKPILAEFMGTLLYLLIGMLVFCSTGDYVATAIAFGIGLAAYLTCFGHISGGHFNPATTIAVFVAGEVHIVLAAIYLTTQLVGGIVAAALTKLLWRHPCGADPMSTELADHEARETIHHLVEEDPIMHEVTEEANNIVAHFQTRDVTESSWWQQFIVEIMLTLTFTFVILMTTKDKMSKTGLAPIIVGLTLTACMLAGGKISRGHLNPARSLGDAIFSKQWTNHYIYWAGPLVGALMAGLLYRFIFAHNRYSFRKRTGRH